MGVSSVMKYTHDFCDILCGIRKEFIRIPNINELSPIIRKFGEKSKIPNVVAAIDGSHIPIKAHLQNKITLVESTDIASSCRVLLDHIYSSLMWLWVSLEVSLAEKWKVGYYFRYPDAIWIEWKLNQLF